MNRKTSIKESIKSVLIVVLTLMTILLLYVFWADLELTRFSLSDIDLGFSDDDVGNVKTVSSFIRSELSKRYEGIKFVVYDTSDRSLSKGRKVCVSGQLNLPGF